MASNSIDHSSAISSVTGMPAGPYPIGCTTLQFNDASRRDPDCGGNTPRRLQTEIWYPASEDTRGAPKNRYSEYLGRGAIPGSIAAAEASDAIGGYLDGLTISQLDASWPNDAVRDARPRDPESPSAKWPLVVFSHGSGAFRASYIYLTEFLASHGFVVMACDHPGSARYTQVDGEVVKPGGQRSRREQMESDRPADLIFLIDCMEKMANQGGDSRFAGRVDATNAAVAGMSFGGFSTAAALELKDPRVKAGIMHCPSIAMSGGGVLPTSSRANLETPILMMTGKEDTVIGTAGNEACRQYYDTHEGPKTFVEINLGGHVSFTSCELYNPNYGNGIGESNSLTDPGTTYTPTPISEQHGIINHYTLAFLDSALKSSLNEDSSVDASRAAAFAALQENPFGDVITHLSRL